MRKEYLTVLLLLGSVPATAQSTTVVDANPLLQLMLTIVATVISTSIPILATYLLRRWKLDKDEVLSKAVTDAASRAAGISYNWILTQAPKSVPIDVKNEAIAQGVSYIQRRLPEYTKTLGLSASSIAEIVDGELGKLLAVDPNVMVGDKINPN